MVGGLLLGLLPLVAAWGVRYYYAGRSPALADVLRTGDALLVVVSWCAVTIVELLDVPPAGRTPRFVAAAITTTALFGCAVAYGCLTADSVTGRVQTRRQAEIVASVSLWMLGITAVTSTAAVAARR